MDKGKLPCPVNKSCWYGSIKWARCSAYAKKRLREKDFGLWSWRPSEKQKTKQNKKNKTKKNREA